MYLYLLMHYGVAGLACFALLIVLIVAVGWQAYQAGILRREPVLGAMWAGFIAWFVTSTLELAPYHGRVVDALCDDPGAISRWLVGTRVSRPGSCAKSFVSVACGWSRSRLESRATTWRQRGHMTGKLDVRIRLARRGLRRAWFIGWVRDRSKENERAFPLPADGIGFCSDRRLSDWPGFI